MSTTSSTTSNPSVRRLADADVRAIFESLHHHKAPPEHLSFKIVTVGNTGLKLSPPSLEFEDGLYVLLRPQSKKKSNDQPQPKAPAHLQHLVEPVALIEDETCPWSLSGPQFPQPTAIQQRYCYPKGRAAYASFKGGALWTMYDANGKEDLEFRLLHVYFSAKRAINRQQSTAVSFKKPRVISRRTVSAPASTISRDTLSTPPPPRLSPMAEEWLLPPASPVVQCKSEEPDDFLSPLTMHSQWLDEDDWLLTANHTQSLDETLEHVTFQLHEQIRSSQEEDRPAKVAALAQWARQLAADPFPDEQHASV